MSVYKFAILPQKGRSAPCVYGGELWPSWANHTLQAENGNFSVDLKDTWLYRQKLMAADSGAFTVGGQPVDFYYFRKLAAETGSFIVEGKDPRLLKQLVIVAEKGAFAVSGKDTGLYQQHVLFCLTGDFAIDGYGDLLRQLLVSADTGSFVLELNDVFFSQNPGQITGILDINIE